MYPLPSGGYVNAVGSVLSFNGRGGAVTLQTSDLLPLGGISFQRKALSGTYSVLTTDIGLNLASGTSTFFQISFGTASAFPANFAVMVTNEDGFGGGGRARFINGVTVDGYGGFFLWPGQSVIVYNSNNQWIAHGRKRFRPAASNINFWVNTVSGTDTYGSTDGLGTGASAFASLGNALNLYILPEIDFGNATVTLNFSGNSSAGFNLGTSALPVGSNAPNIIIDGSSTGVISAQISVYYGMAVQFQNLIFNTTGLLTAQNGGTIFIGSGNVFGAMNTGYGHLYALYGGKIFVNANYTINGGGAWHVVCGFAGTIIYAGTTVTVSGSPTFASAVFQVQSGYCNGPTTWSGGTPTGQRYNVSYNGVGFNASLVPGTIAGSTQNGGQIT
jgi:hypothetical protein